MKDPILALMREARITASLTQWLLCNFLDPYSPEAMDAELLEVLPERFHEEFIARVKLYNELESKFEAETLAKKAGHK